MLYHIALERSTRAEACIIFPDCYPTCLRAPITWTPMIIGSFYWLRRTKFSFPQPSHQPLSPLWILDHSCSGHVRLCQKRRNCIIYALNCSMVFGWTRHPLNVLRSGPQDKFDTSLLNIVYVVLSQPGHSCGFLPFCLKSLYLILSQPGISGGLLLFCLESLYLILSQPGDSGGLLIFCLSSLYLIFSSLAAWQFLWLAEISRGIIRGGHLSHSHWLFSLCSSAWWLRPLPYFLHLVIFRVNQKIFCTASPLISASLRNALACRFQ